MKNLIKKLEDSGINIINGKIAKADVEKAIAIASQQPKILCSWYSQDFKSLQNSSILRMRHLQELVNLVKKNPNGKLIQGKDSNCEVIVYAINADNVSDYSDELKELIKNHSSIA